MLNSKKVRIVLSSNTAWTIYNFRLGVIKGLLEKGCEVFILAAKDYTTNKLIACGCSFVHMPIEGRGVNPFKDLAIIKKYVQVYKNIQPDFAFHFTVKPAIYGAIAAKITGINSISVTTGLGYAFIRENWIAKTVRFLYRRALKFPLEIWFLNQEDLHVFLKLKLVSLDKSFVLPGEGIDTDFFRPQIKKAPTNKIYFLMIARLIWDKGVAEFVEAARLVKAKYPNAVFQLLGEMATTLKNGVPEHIFNQWVEEGVIVYLGTTQDIRGFIAQADCVVLPSYREGIPRSLLEASAMAIPVITTDTAGCRDVVLDQESGLLCKVKNSQDLAAKIAQFMQMDHVAKNKMGVVGRRYVLDRFDERKVIDIYFEKLREYGIFS